MAMGEDESWLYRCCTQISGPVTVWWVFNVDRSISLEDVRFPTIFHRALPVHVVLTSLSPKRSSLPIPYSSMLCFVILHSIARMKRCRLSGENNKNTKTNMTQLFSTMNESARFRWYVQFFFFPTIRICFSIWQRRTCATRTLQKFGCSWKKVIEYLRGLKSNLWSKVQS